MLTVTIKEDKSILEKCGCDDALILMGVEDGLEKGYVAFKQNGYVIDIVGFEVYYSTKELSGESFVIADTLIKSLASYALNHSCYYIESSKKELYDILSRFTFTENNDKLTSNLSKILKVCEN